MRKVLLLVLLLALFAGFAAAQTVATRTTQADLAAHIDQLRAEAKSGDGSASIKLETHPHDFTMLALRLKTGNGEVHEHWADYFYVVRGHARLLTGGTLAGSHSVSDGESRGSAVDGGQETDLSPGDFVHIPAGVPHQLLIANGEELVYYVIKVEEK
jgi:mannose-6-phosphate isomerase-like protein (cupin superfamily)